MLLDVLTVLVVLTGSNLAAGDARAVRRGAVDRSGRSRAAATHPARGKRLLLHANRESLSRSDGHIGVEHIALDLVGSRGGLAPEIVFTLGGPAPLLRTAILDRYRMAG